MNLSDYRKKAGLSQAALAAALTAAGSPATQALVSQWESGAVTVPPERCPPLEAILAAPCEDLRPDVSWNRDDEGRITGYTVPLSAQLDPAA